MDSGKIKVVIVDDHPIVRKGIESFIEDEDDVEIVGEASSPGEALILVEATAPDVAVVDICLEDDASGLDLIKTLRDGFPEVKVLVLSMYDEEIYSDRARSLGAKGYLQKNKGPKMIVDAIKEIVAGGTFFTHGPGENEISIADKAPRDRGKLIVHSLSNRELEIFQLFGQGLETNDIASRLNLSKHTVDSHRKNIKDKLKIPRNNELVMIATHWVSENMKKVY